MQRKNAAKKTFRRQTSKIKVKVRRATLCLGLEGRALAHFQPGDYVRVWRGKYETLELDNIERPDKIVLGFSSSTEKDYWVQSIKGAKKKRILEVGIVKDN